MTTRRQHPRFDIALPCEATDAQGRVNTRTLNVSRGGALVDHPGGGGVISLTLELPGGEQVAALSRVRHCSNGTGVEFKVMDVEGREVWQGWLDAWIRDNTPERRAADRVETDLLVWASSDDGMRGYPVRDISSRGVFLHTPRPLATGTALSAIVIDPASTDSVQVTGRVAWARTDGPPEDHGIGVRFDATPEIEALLLGLIES